MQETKRTRLDRYAICSGLFLPLLGWTGSVIVISLLGYPQVLRLTPLAWLLAIPLGLRIRRESHSPEQNTRREAAAGGALLGLWQSALLIISVIRWPSIIGTPFQRMSSLIFTGLLATAISMVVTSLLAVVASKIPRPRD
jgi:hypothetical protein